MLSGARPSEQRPIHRRAETGLGALRAYLRYVREDRHTAVRDDAGREFSLAQLLEVANREAADDAVAHRQVVSVLADLVDTSLRPWDDTVPFEYPPAVYWRDAGQSWAVRFDQQPPDALLKELAARYEHPRCDLLIAGAETILAERRDRARRLGATGETASDDVLDAAERLKRRYFDLLDLRSGRDPHDRDWQRKVETYGVLAGPRLDAAVNAAESELHGFLRQHRGALAGNRRFDYLYEGLDNSPPDQARSRRRGERAIWARESRPSSPPSTPERGSGPGHQRGMS